MAEPKGKPGMNYIIVGCILLLISGYNVATRGIPGPATVTLTIGVGVVAFALLLVGAMKLRG